ncbi:hypothetical protein JCM33374_g436 [Metschnikowia sp. JCM 33374]|nr:hypothetical protein JCM33374_g436 [Metschnikowia sp. JCM 33374]
MKFQNLAGFAATTVSVANAMYMKNIDQVRSDISGAPERLMEPYFRPLRRQSSSTTITTSTLDESLPLVTSSATSPSETIDEEAVRSKLIKEFIERMSMVTSWAPIAEETATVTGSVEGFWGPLPYTTMELEYKAVFDDEDAKIQQRKRDMAARVAPLDHRRPSHRGSVRYGHGLGKTKREGVEEQKREMDDIHFDDKRDIGQRIARSAEDQADPNGPKEDPAATPTATPASTPKGSKAAGSGKSGNVLDPLGLKKIVDKVKVSIKNELEEMEKNIQKFSLSRLF